MTSFEYVVFQEKPGMWGWRLFQIEGQQYSDKKTVTEVGSGTGYEDEEAAEDDAAFELVARCC